MDKLVQITLKQNAYALLIDCLLLKTKLVMIDQNAEDVEILPKQAKGMAYDKNLKKYI